MSETALKTIKDREKISWIRCDVSNAKDVEKLCAAIRKQHGRLDVHAREAVERNRTQRDDDSQRLPRDDQADGARSDREQHALGERETDESPAPRAEPHANRELAATRPGAQ